MKKHILFIVENNAVPQDIRVWNEALSVKEFGYDVSVICPKMHDNALPFERLEEIEIYRHEMPVEASGKLSFIFEYANALFWELFLSIKIFSRKKFHVIHSANPPDHVFLIASIFKLFQVKFIFDHHDIAPENYLAKFDKKDFFYYFLLLMEKLTFGTADLVISTNESYKKIAIKRGGQSPDKVHVVRNGPNLSRIEYVSPNNSLQAEFDHLVAYVGIIGNQEGIDILLKIVNYVVYEKKVTNVKFVIIGKGPNLYNMIKLSNKMKLEKYVEFTGYIPYHNFYEYISTADLCVNPEFKNEFTDRSTMLKIMDYMVMGKPILMFETTEGIVTARDAAVYIRKNDIKMFGDKLLSLLNDNNKL
jgi:glycosyltransferase involved in cell wall biosynthesis